MPIGLHVSKLKQVMIAAQMERKEPQPLYNQRCGAAVVSEQRKIFALREALALQYTNR